MGRNHVKMSSKSGRESVFKNSIENVFEMSSPGVQIGAHNFKKKLENRHCAPWVSAGVVESLKVDAFECFWLPKWLPIGVCGGRVVSDTGRILLFWGLLERCSFWRKSARTKTTWYSF